MGLCIGIRVTVKAARGGKVEFIVLINERVTERKDVIETAIHELLHTAAPTDSHGGKWKAYAEIVNTNTEYRITRTADRKLSEKQGRVVRQTISRQFAQAVCEKKSTPKDIRQ